MSTFVSPTDVSAGTLIRSSSLNDLDAAVATAFGVLPTEVNLAHGTVNYAVDTGTANAYLVALPHTPSGYVDGLRVTFRAINTNTTTSTVNVNSLGVKSIRLTNSDALAAGDITTGAALDIVYSTATGFFHLASSAAAGAYAAASTASAAAALVSENAAAGSANTATTKAGEASASADAAAASVASIAGGPVASINSLTGVVVLKTINGTALTGAGAITTAILGANTFTATQTISTGILELEETGAGTEILSLTAPSAISGNTTVTLPAVTSTLAILGANSFTGTQTLGDNNLATIKTATFNGRVNNATTTGAVTIDWSTGMLQTQAEPTGVITYTFTDPVGPCHLELYIASDGTNTAQTHVWPGTVIWLGTTWAGADNKKSFINFSYDGTNYYAQGVNQV